MIELIVVFVLGIACGPRVLKRTEKARTELKTELRKLFDGDTYTPHKED